MSANLDSTLPCALIIPKRNYTTNWKPTDCAMQNRFICESDVLIRSNYLAWCWIFFSVLLHLMLKISSFNWGANKHLAGLHLWSCWGKLSAQSLMPLTFKMYAISYWSFKPLKVQNVNFWGEWKTAEKASGSYLCWSFKRSLLVSSGLRLTLMKQLKGSVILASLFACWQRTHNYSGRILNSGVLNKERTTCTVKVYYYINVLTNRQFCVTCHL